MANPLYSSFLFLGGTSSTGLLVAIALASAAAYYVLTRPKPFKSVADFNAQTIEVSGSGRVRANAVRPTMMDLTDFDAKTLHDLFLRGVQISGEGKFLGWRSTADEEYCWMSYNEAHEKAHALGSALVELGYGKGNLIGISAVNKPEWVIVDQGSMMFSMVLVPLYGTFGAKGLDHILKQTELSIIFCDTAKVKDFVEIAKDIGCVKHIVVFGTVTDQEIRTECNTLGIQLLEYDKVLELGREHLREKNLPSPDDLAVICYTSGTTGNPKGVMLTHANIVINILSGKYIETKVCGFKMTKDDCVISYLPLCHMYGRGVEYSMMYEGASIGYFRGDIKELINDIQALRPTFFPSVPRLLNALHNKVSTELSKSWFKSCIFNIAMKFKYAELKRGIIRQDSIWDRLVFRKVQSILGGRIRRIVTGSAPLTQEVMNFLKCALGCHVNEGYGQTEATALVTATYTNDPEIGHVGPPAPCCRVKLVDVAEMNYFADDGKGEICVQGPSVFKGYYKDSEKTSEALDKDGWLHSGDIGCWEKNGTLRVIDRKKQMFKLAQGEYISPEVIQNVYLRSPLIAQAFVTGNSLKTCTVAIITPNFDALQHWAKQNNVNGTIEELCNNAIVKKAIFASVIKEGNAANLNSLEQVKAIHLLPEMLTVESGLLTPTLKAKRPIVEKHFTKEIEAMYEKIGEKQSSFLS